MKKDVKKFEFNIPSRLLYTIIAVFVVSLVAFGVYAYGTSNPSNFGHSFGEVDPPTGCNSGEYLQWDGSAWTCATPTPTSQCDWTGWGTYSCPPGKELIDGPFYTSTACTDQGYDPVSQLYCSSGEITGARIYCCA